MGQTIKTLPYNTRSAKSKQKHITRDNQIIVPQTRKNKVWEIAHKQNQWIKKTNATKKQCYENAVVGNDE